MRRRHMLGTTTRHLALLAAVPLLLTACGDSGTDDAGGGAADDAPSSAAPSPDGPPCPDELAGDGEGSVAGTEEPAAEAPDLPAATAAWRCRYASAEADGETRWQREGEPVELAEDELAAATGVLDGLEPAPSDRMCTMDLGPRWMVVLEHEGGRVGAVVDGFGCRDVRLTDDPAEVVPGAATSDGVPAGVLTGPEDRLEVLSGGATGP